MPIVEQKESIKLTKNSKGYNWEIKIIDFDKKGIESYFERLEKINDFMVLKYGCKEVER